MLQCTMVIELLSPGDDEMDEHGISFFGLLMVIWISLTPVHAQEETPEWAELSERWAKIRYEYPAERRVAALEALREKSKAMMALQPERAEPMVWHAVILSSLGRFVGGSEGLGLAKQAKRYLDQAEKIQPEALDGLIYTLKGSLYLKVPGWPVGFGDPLMAQSSLLRALEIDPGNIDANFFYGEYHMHNRNYSSAIESFERVLSAEPRPGQGLADAGRKREARAGIAEARESIQRQQQEVERVLQ
ncbi:MAG: hypothetical protein ABW076_04165 [Candidatus Thiodiazotropha sp.]